MQNYKRSKSKNQTNLLLFRVRVRLMQWRPKPDWRFGPWSFCFRIVHCSYHLFETKRDVARVEATGQSDHCLSNDDRPNYAKDLRRRWEDMLACTKRLYNN